MQRPSFFQQLGMLCLVLMLAVSQVFAATSQQFTLPGTSVTFGDNYTPTLTFSAKATLTGQVGALYDKGAGAQPSLWQFQCQISLNGTHTIGATLEYYLVTSQDGSTVDGGVGTANAALASADKRRNLIPMGVLVVDQTTNLTSMYATFRNVYIPTRYFTLAFWNATAISTETSTTKHKCTGTPMPPQMQAN